MIKTFLKSPLVQTALGRLLGWYMLLVTWTTRWEYIDRKNVEELWAWGGPVVGLFWHSRVVQTHLGWDVVPGRAKHQDGKVMISHSREGAIAAEATRTVGAGVVRGSSAKKGGDTKGALEAMRDALRHLKNNGGLAIAPDGPRGPRMRVQMGAVQLAKMSGARVICWAWSTSGRRVFNSWDRFVLPYPFGRGVFVWSNVFTVPKDAGPAEMEAMRVTLENELLRITNEADRRAGGEIVMPDPLPATVAPVAAEAV